MYVYNQIISYFGKVSGLIANSRPANHKRASRALSFGCRSDEVPIGPEYQACSVGGQRLPVRHASQLTESVIAEDSLKLQCPSLRVWEKEISETARTEGGDGATQSSGSDSFLQRGVAYSLRKKHQGAAEKFGVSVRTKSGFIASKHGKCPTALCPNFIRQIGVSGAWGFRGCLGN